MSPEYPIYIVSKGRWDSQLTSQQLHKLGVLHHVVIEAQEYDRYNAAANASATLLVLDTAYQRDYDTCDDLGDSKSRGPGAARNFAWDHSISNRHLWHWVMDDNIKRFMRLNRNRKTPVGDGTILRCMEDFTSRYENVAMAGPNYAMFAKQKQLIPPFITNTRIYSCNLIRNDVPFRWRGRYNEDTDLSLRMLKDGWATIQFNAFLQVKRRTQTMKGGNTAEFYSKEGTLPKSQMLANLHPDVARVIWRFGRVHHYVDYRSFTQRLRRRPDVDVPTGVNEYGMRFERKEGEKWAPVG